jgi:hypothetical protein
VLLLLALVASSAPATGGSHVASANDDAQDVFCLAPARINDLVNAAVTLRLARQGPASGMFDDSSPATPITADAWRRSQPQKFQRACAALVSATALPQAAKSATSQTDLRSTLKVLLPVTAGALLALLAGEWRSARDRGRLEADGIRSAAISFRQTIDDYLRAWSAATVIAAPDPGAIEQRLRDLSLLLRRIQLRKARWCSLNNLLGKIDIVKYRREWFADWPPGQDARRGKARVIETEVDDFVAHIEDVAVAVERWSKPHRQAGRFQISSSQTGAERAQ